MICSRCNLDKQADAFAKGRKVCIECRKKDKKTFRKLPEYKNNPDHHKNRQRRALEFVIQQKQKPCMDCHNTFPSVAMDFDHVRGDKIAHVGTMVSNGRSFAVIAAEIAKCDLVCSNCHRIRTALRGEWRTS